MRIRGFCSAVLLCLTCFLISDVSGQDIFDRNSVIELLREKGLGDQLDSGVRIQSYDQDLLCIFDEGNYFYQYLIMGEENGADSGDLKIASSVSDLKKKYYGIIVVTHGWIDKGYESWPWDMISEIHRRVDHRKWLCVAYDWHGGSGVANPIDAAKYARYIAGPRLAAAIDSLNIEFEHVHLIGHSAGTWVIDSAARGLAKDHVFDLHLTFLDAFIPAGWDDKYPGSIDAGGKFWSDHYYTRDYTLGTTEKHIVKACNVDLTEIEPGIKEHKFPFRWYGATVKGKYFMDHRELNKELVEYCGSVKMGFARSREFSLTAWNESLNLGCDNMVMHKRAISGGFMGWFSALFK